MFYSLNQNVKKKLLHFNTKASLLETRDGHILIHINQKTGEKPVNVIKGTHFWRIYQELFQLTLGNFFILFAL